MPRVVKHPEQRRTELLDHAFGLFLSRGYDHVSLNEVIADAGISKGAFYHYFDSKEALLTALAERSARQTLAELQRAMSEPGKNALERLNAGLMAGYRVKMEMGAPEQLVAMIALFRPENAALYRRIVAASEAVFRPLLTSVITEGVQTGIFHTFDPEGVGDMIQGFAAGTPTMIARVTSAISEKERQDAIEAFLKRLRLHGLATDRILGLPDGSIHVLSRSQVERLVAALPRKYEEPHKEISKASDQR